MYTPPAELEVGELQLVGLDGNAFSIMGAVERALKRAGNSTTIIDDVMTAMQSGDYDHLLQVAMTVTYEPEEPEGCPY